MLSFLYETLDWMLNDHFSSALRQIDKEEELTIATNHAKEIDDKLLVFFTIKVRILGIYHDVATYSVDENRTLWSTYLPRGQPKLVSRNVKHIDVIKTDQVFYVTDDNTLYLEPIYRTLSTAPDTPPITFKLPSGVRKCFTNAKYDSMAILTMDNLLYRITRATIKLLCPDRIAWVEPDHGELYCTIPVSYTHLTLPTNREV